MKNFLMITLFLIFTGCGGGIHGGTYMYSGTGSFSDFADARYQCSVSASGQGASGYANNYGAYFGSGPVVNCGILDACMASKGFIRNPSGQFDASSMSVSCSR